MGKTRKPLTILVHPSLAKWEEVRVLQAQGHRVLGLTPEDPTESPDASPAPSGGHPLSGIDLVLGPTCWRMNPDLRDYFDLAIAEAKKMVYNERDKQGGRL